MSRILIVEDENELAETIREWLEDEYYTVSIVNEGISAWQNIQSKEYEIIVLDWMLPGMNGIEICKQFRKSGGKTPIIILTAKSAMSAKEEGLDSGADDYLTKPFDLRELSARIRALLRRPQPVTQTILQSGNIILNRNSRMVYKDNQSLRLLPKEFMLLEVLFLHGGTVMHAEELIELIWGKDSEIAPDTVRSHLKSLRKKLDSPGHESIIKTVHGMGYKIEGD